eukprot:scaffold113757_cov63-Phaeocystis_antarctica.AAC.1
MTAVYAFHDNPASAIATYGPMADWDVSAISDMSQLFYDTKLKNFNAELSNWDTSGVTDMSDMFSVRYLHALPPICSRDLPCKLRALLYRQPPPNSLRLYTLLSTLGRARRLTSR